MRANRRYELIVTKGGLLDPERIDHVEILDIDTGEVALFWDLLPHQTGRMSRALRADLSQLEDDEFLEKWQRYEVG